MIQLKDVDLRISSFTGPLMDKITHERKMCDVCGKERAMWIHNLKNRQDAAYLCFKCGGH